MNTISSPSPPFDYTDHYSNAINTFQWFTSPSYQLSGYLFSYPSQAPISFEDQRVTIPPLTNLKPLNPYMLQLPVLYPCHAYPTPPERQVPFPRPAHLLSTSNIEQIIPSHHRQPSSSSHSHLSPNTWLRYFEPRGFVPVSFDLQGNAAIENILSANIFIPRTQTQTQRNSAGPEQMESQEQQFYHQNNTHTEGSNGVSSFPSGIFSGNKISEQSMGFYETLPHNYRQQHIICGKGQEGKVDTRFTLPGQASLSHIPSNPSRQYEYQAPSTPRSHSMRKEGIAPQYQNKQNIPTPFLPQSQSPTMSQGQYLNEGAEAQVSEYQLLSSPDDAKNVTRDGAASRKEGPKKTFVHFHKASKGFIEKEVLANMEKYRSEYGTTKDLFDALDDSLEEVYEKFEKRAFEIRVEPHLSNISGTRTVHLEGGKQREAEPELKATNGFLSAFQNLQGSNRPENMHKMSKLPKNGKIVLEKWVAENYHYPYPSEEEKRRLCEVTQIDYTKLCNWFVNFRQRSWKPSTFKGVDSRGLNSLNSHKK